MLPDINWNEFFFKYRFQILFFLIGAILVGLGLFIFKDKQSLHSSSIEVLEDATEGLGENLEIVVEVAGAVEKPGVYKLTKGARVEEALISSGGISADANRLWMEKSLNRAAKLIDGQKIYIPREDEQISGVSASNLGQGSGLINVNVASQKELESLWGIGPVTAQNIIEQRPYSSVEELLSKKILKSNVYERNKDKLSVY